ncbi:MAG: hypothetical protein EZS28_051633 [Streblomastix strix]|uniref:Reverse transcriptase domain-containing protein n=1 Tax=Streblomastix strix TaxID=222440 RepID=A0A5J4T502_9EUKA|nr:MAG: hypothetical protein EZS28_051633 [Streblomastix strix]
MVEPYIPDKETQWNIDKDSRCEQAEQGNRKTKIQNPSYSEGILLIHQDKQILKTQTVEIMKTLEQFGWTISTEKRETEPKQIIVFLGWVWYLKGMSIRMSEGKKKLK